MSSAGKNGTSNWHHVFCLLFEEEKGWKLEEHHHRTTHNHSSRIFIFIEFHQIKIYSSNSSELQLCFSRAHKNNWNSEWVNMVLCRVLRRNWIVHTDTPLLEYMALLLHALMIAVFLLCCLPSFFRLHHHHSGMEKQSCCKWPCTTTTATHIAHHE